VKKYDTGTQATDDDKIWRLRWLTNATHTLRICNIYCFSTATMVSRMLFSVTFII